MIFLWKGSADPYDLNEEEEESEDGDHGDPLADIELLGSPRRLAEAMKNTLTNLATSKPLMDVTLQEVLDDLSKTLGRTPRQMSSIMGEIKAHYKRTMTAMLQPHNEVPL